jgi:hypothetical protein
MGPLIDRLLNSYRFRRGVGDLVRRQTGRAKGSDPYAVSLPPLPEVAPKVRASAEAGRGAVFITARFRTGSTFLWQLFNRLEGYAAFYEPLNERHGGEQRWGAPDPTHRGAADYRLNYDRVGDLRELHHESWTFERLYMDGADWDQDLFDYVAALCAIPGAVPVLQFNRVDFRLAWLRAHFPAARIVHLHRNPRDQWMSMLGDRPVTPETSVAAFEDHDRFYLLPWARDLAGVYPFLEPSIHRSPYALHYLIWRLSHAQGVHHADVSIAYESLVRDPAGSMREVLSACGLPPDPDGMESLGEANDPPPSATWNRFAPDAWFREVERSCEAVLRAAFRQP